MTRDILFKAFTSPKIDIPNRLVMTAMGRAYADDGAPQVDRYGPYFARRAEGGIGLMITGATAIDRPLSDYDGSGPRIDSDAARAAWSRIVAMAHEAGGKLALQLWHSGMERHVEAFTDPAAEGPSGISIADLDAGREASGSAMDRDALAATRESFAKAASDAQEIGFDGVEVHCGHGFLLDQFLWSRTNLRTDEYGGSPENRARFPAEVVAACRDAVGQDFPLLARISQFKIGAYEDRIAETPDELGRLLAPLVDAGVDIFDCSQREATEPAFPGDPRNLAGWVKHLTGKPTIAVGSVGLGGVFTEEEAATPGEGLPPPSLDRLDEVCEMMARGEFDLLAIGRALLGEPEWPKKVAQGHDDFGALTIAAMTELR